MARDSDFLVSASRGMRRDVPRHQLPKGTVWNLVDWLPSQGAPARKRGGWSYASPDLSTVKATAARVEVVVHAPFSAASKLVAIDEDGELYTVASSVSATDVGAVGYAPSGVTFHRDTLILTADGSTPKKYTGAGSISSLSGSPPTAAYAAVYKDRTVFAKTTANPNRVWFSAAGNPASWDTTNTYIDTTYAITAIAALRNAVLVFSADRVERIRGDIPPPATNMVLEGLFDQGTPNFRSIAPYGDGVIFANPTGIFLTDGVTLLDLTDAGGISQYWQTLMESFTSNYILASGVYRGHYILAVVNYPSTFVDCLVCDIERRVWFRLSNLPALLFGHSQGSAAEELYFGSGAEARVGKLSSIFSPAASVKNDANGTAVTPVLETPFTELGALKRIKALVVGYDLRDAATDNPTLTVSYLTSPEATAYTALSPTLAETSAYTRKRVPVNRRSNGFGFKIAQSNASSDSYFYGLAIEGHELEASRRG